MARKSCDMPENIRDIKPGGALQRALWAIDDTAGLVVSVFDFAVCLYMARARGGWHKIAVLRPKKGTAGYPGILARELLRSFGVAAWGWAQDRHCAYVYVGKRQAEWAERILANRGVPLVASNGRIIRHKASGEQYIPWKEGGSKAREAQAQPKQSTAQRVAGWFK